MKTLKYNRRKKEYSGVALSVAATWLDGQFIVVGPNMKLLKKFYREMGGTLDVRLCKKLKVKLVGDAD